MPFPDNALLRKPLPEVRNAIEIGVVPSTTGAPRESPTPDQLPLAHDPTTGILWFYSGEWKPFGLNSLTEVNLENITNLENVLRIPVMYNNGNAQVEGYLTLKEFKKL